MSVHLLTVERVEKRGDRLQLAPSVPISRLAAANPDVMMPVQGDMVRLVTPDGRELKALVAMFGVEAWEVDGYVYTDSDPRDPRLTLTITITGDLEPEDVPPGTEVWQHQPRRAPGY